MLMFRRMLEANRSCETLGLFQALGLAWGVAMSMSAVYLAFL